jgi:phosphoribosyl 1,2-cyclic phosphodiesterase
MSLFIASLNSGSNGNAYYVGNDREAILVDAGLSCRETERRMRKLGLSLSNVKGIFISHEHDDHIRGLEILSRRYQIPVYITEATLRQLRCSLDGHLVNTFRAHETVCVGDLFVRAFPKTHDASDPHSFVVSSSTVRIGVITDIGFACENVIRHFAACHAAFLEANYDEQLLEEGRYPWPLKNRIRGGQGHISNRQALELFVKYRPAYMSHLLLSHLSKDNNRPELVRDLFEEQAQGTRIIIASRDEASEVYHVEGAGAEAASWPGWEAVMAMPLAPAGTSAASAARAHGREGEVSGSDGEASGAGSGSGDTAVSAATIRRRKVLAAKITAAGVVQTSLF